MPPEPDLVFPPFRLDLEHEQLWRGTDQVPLRPKAFAVLHYLAAHAPRLVTAADLLQAVWKDAYVSEGLLRGYIRELRAVLGDEAQAPRFIATVVRRGWRFLAPMTTVTPGAPERPRQVGPDEHKLVTVMVAGLHGVMTLAQAVEAEELYTLLRRAAALMRQEVERFEGTVTQCTGDHLVALFGAPLAQEDHVVRALQAALGLQRVVAAFADELRHTRAPELVPGVGVHTGSLVLGPLSPDARPDVAAPGFPVFLAERLQTLATEGAIYVSEAVWQQAKSFFRFQDRGRCPVPEMAQPVPVYACTGVTPGVSRLMASLHRHQSPLLGRERDLELLGSLWTRACRGQGQVVVLFGEAGVGKSRLADAFQRTLPAGHTLAAHTLSYGQAMPYHALLPVLRTVLGLSDHDTPPQQRQALRAWLTAVPPALAADAPLLADLLGVPLEAEALPHLPPAEQKRRLQHACVQVLLQSATAQPLCLLIEDLHWLDPSSQELLDVLVTAVAGQPVLVLGTARPGFRDTWSDYTYYHRLTVVPLSEELTATFIDDYLQPYGAAPTLTALLRARTAGNPFFLEEMLRILQEQALLVVQDDVYGVPPDVPLALPASVQGLLAARIDRLPAEAKALLQTAAVIGTDVPLSLLQAIADVPEAALHRGLAHLQAAEFLYETRLFPEPNYTFKHALTHEVAYGSLLLERRRGLHARLVEALEALAPERVAEHVERLAHHALRGEVWAKAVTYCQQVGARARDRAAFREALASFEQALQALAHLPKPGDTRVLALELRLALGTPLSALGEYGRCLALLGEAEALARALDDRARLVQVLTRMGETRRMTGDHDGAIAAGRQALDLAAELGESALQVQASYFLGQTYEVIGDFVRAAELQRQSVEAADCESGTSSTDFRSRSRARLATILGALGAFAEGRCHGEEALRLATLAGRGLTPIIAHGSLGELYLVQGDLEPAIRVLEPGLALCRASGDRTWLRRFAGGLGYAYALQGRPAEGRALLEEASSEALRTGGRINHARWVAWLSEVCRLAGRREEAWQHAHQALDLARQYKERGNEARALHQLGVVQAHADPPDAIQAEAHYQQALALAEELGMRPLVAHCHLGLGQLYCQTGHGEQARIELATAIDLYRAMDMTFWLPQAEAVLTQMG
jgi:class 3 adenylate cyclase/tetratricopeptide (TPR) repeat protein